MGSSLFLISVPCFVYLLLNAICEPAIVYLLDGTYSAPNELWLCIMILTFESDTLCLRFFTGLQPLQDS